MSNPTSSSDKSRFSGKSSNSAASIPTVSRDNPIALSYAQDRYSLLSLVEPNNTVYHLTTAVRLRGLLQQVPALRAALSALVQRHEALRTVVGVADGKQVQRILPRTDLPLQEEDSSNPPPIKLDVDQSDAKWTP